MLCGIVTAHALITVDPLVRHSACHGQAIKNPGERTLSSFFLPVTLLPLSLLSTLSLSVSLYLFSMRSHTLTAVYYWRVISSLRVSTARSQAHPVKHMPDQRAPLRLWVFLQL